MIPQELTLPNKIVSWVLAMLSGWNIAVVVWILLSTLTAAVMSNFDYAGNVNKLLFLCVIVISLYAGYKVGVKLNFKFLQMEMIWKMILFFPLLAVTLLLLPALFTYT